MIFQGPSARLAGSPSMLAVILLAATGCCLHGAQPARDWSASRDTPFAVELGGRRIKAQSKPTGSWNEFVPVKIGQCRVDKPGVHTLSVKPIDAETWKPIGLLEVRLGPASKPQQSASASRPNILFILSDNQSYYEMSCHGHARIRTPHIDTLAKQGVEFSNFHAPPFCSPSRAVILTGQYAMRSGVHDTIGGRSIMHRDKTTIADVLKNHGYRTAIFGKWHLGFSYPHRPQDRGFEEVFVHGGGGIGQMEDYYGNTHYGPTFIHNGKPVPTKGFSTDALFDRAMQWIEKRRKEPFFCFLSTPVTHSPHQGPKALVERLKADGVTDNLHLFAQVQNLDANIGRILGKLDALGLTGKTIIVYASDQGMSDRGAPHGGNRMSLAHDPAHHVPFMVRMPGAAPRITHRLAGMIDFFPTVLDLCGIEPPESCDGLSLKPLLEGRDADYPPERTLIIQCPRGRDAAKWKNAAVKTDRWRLVEGAKLYDAQADPRQKNDVASRHPGVVAELRKKYEAYWADLPDQSRTLSRHILGAEACPQVVLNGMDWYTGDRPWHAGHFRRGGNGSWPVTVLKDGKYAFDCRIFPSEAEKPSGATRARIRIGDLEKELAVDAAAPGATFELDLKAGEYDLQTWLTQGGRERGALFVYVTSR